MIHFPFLIFKGPIAWPKYDPGLYPPKATSEPAPFPTRLIDPNAGRHPRGIQWSTGIPRENPHTMAAEISYAGDLGAWRQANDPVDCNAVTPAMLQSRPIDIDDANDRARWLSPAQARR